MTQKMKAGIYKSGLYQGKLEAEVVEIDKPEVGPNDILVKTVRSSICGSDINGMGPEDGKQFGHETGGYVVELGKNVKGFKEGDRVWLHPIHTMKGGRYSCQMGGFSEYILVPDAEVGVQAWPLADSISWDEASLIEPFGVGTRGKNRPGAKPGDNVVVYGAGSIGLFCLSGLVAQGITPVVVDIVLSDYKRALLEKMGVVIAPMPEEGDKFEFLAEHFGTLPQRNSGMAINVDIVVDCAGAPTIVEDFFKLCKENSRLSIVGIGRPQELQLTRLMSTEAILMGSSGYNDSDIKEVIDNLASGRTFVKEIITHHYPLDKLQEALLMAADKTQAIKVVIDME
jgi:threonine dehydrogenase-like Zn-dependent dehydrogenase